MWICARIRIRIRKWTLYTKFVIFDELEKFHTNSREFVKVMLRMACTVNDFEELLWEDINDVNLNLNGKFDNFYEKVHTTVIQHAPLKKVTRSN